MAGPKINPFGSPAGATADDDLKSWLSSLIEDINYDYYDNENILVAVIPGKKISSTWWILAGLLGGITVGILSRWTGPATQEML